MVDPASRSPGSALAGLAATLVSVVRTRLELAATEWEEERLRLGRALLATLAMVFCAAMALIVATALVVAAFWDEHRLAALGIVTGLYLVGALASHAVATRALRAKPRLFDATLTVLEGDQEALVSRRDP